MKRTSLPRIIFALTALCLVNEIFAQADTVRNADQFVFPEFAVGIAKLKNGEKVVLNLNYNIVTEKMVFMQKNQIYNIVNESTIDTVYIEGRKFIPFEKAFYEVCVNGPAVFFIQHKGSVKRPPRPAAYGGTSQVSSSTYISNLKLGNDVYRNEHKGDIIIEQSPLYWIRNGDEYIQVTSRTSLLKALNDRNSEIKQFITRSKADPENPEHIASVVRFYNGLPR